EFTVNSQVLPRIIEPVTANQSLDLFEDFVYDGDKLMIELKCLDSGQYFGVARPDLYIAAAESSFALNYIKGFFSIYLQVLILTSFGVLFSTFLGGALSLIGTIIVAVAGYFMQYLVQDGLPGGLLFESGYRVITQKPMTTQLEPSLLTSGVQAADVVVGACLRALVNIFPDLTKIWTIDYVTNGFNIPGAVLAIQVVTALGLFLPLFVLSHFILKCREVAK
ncbi:MAG: hypothetical protein MPJ50_09460, partial [Pirellulales bacterium]|nr:hypothetical protein [Pirellulales bacterium]